ncbi:MAG: InlB B-repeat-containing protein [Tissierellia bacterium]|nr:InlB B-repeat-containing protein [Tissierellia bacterium]
MMKNKQILAFLLALFLCLGMVPIQVLAEGQPEGVPIDEAHFPDPVFRQVMTDSFGADGALSQEEIAATTTLSLSGVKSLKGIEYFPNLETLLVTRHELTFVDLSNNTKLKTLRLDGTIKTSDSGYKKVISKTNNLSHLDLSKNVNLETLYLTAIAIEDLDLSNNTQLQIVDVRNTITIQDRPFSLGLLKSVNFGNNPNLKTVVLTGNKLSELDLSGTPNIEGLHLGYNAFKDLDISSLPKIKSVSADGNQIVFFNPSDENFQTLTNYELKKQHRYVPIDANKLWDPLGPDGDTTLMEGVKNLNYGSTKDYKFWFNYTFDDNKTPRWMTYNYSVGDKRTLYQTSLTPYNQWTYGMKLEEGDEFLDASQVEVFADGVKVNDPFGTARFKAGQKITLKAKDGNTIDRLTISRTSYIGLYENPDIQESENNEVTFTIRNYHPYLNLYKGQATHTITYDKGEGDKSLKQVVVDGNLAEEPAKPTKEGFSFAGWYTDAEFTNEYSHDAPVTGDLTLYAKWEEISVTIDPETADVVKGGNQTFTATVANATDTSVTWSVEGNTSTATSISAEGTLTVGADESAQTLTIKATSVADPTKSATATVSVKEPVSISISPTTAEVVKGDSQAFTATVANATDTSVTWTVEGNSSTNTTIDTEGTLTVAADESAQTLTVKATSVADPTKSATATVTVKEPVSISISPTTAEVVKGDSQAFTANVENATDTRVTWSVAGNTSTATSISAEGTLTVAADESATELSVKATSVADTTKSATATVSVKDPVPQTFTVTFEANGGSALSNQTVTENEKATRPDDPTREGFTFVGWFQDQDLTTPYDFESPVTGDLTLYAKWEEVVPVSVTISPTTAEVVKGGSQAFRATVENATDTSVTWSVTGNTSTATSISAEGTLTVAADERATTLTVKATSVADNTKVATATVTLTEPAPQEVTVTFDTKGGSPVGPQTLATNAKATRPGDPTRKGFTFVGWFQDQALTSPYDFDSPVPGDLTLYAKWKKLAKARPSLPKPMEEPSPGPSPSLWLRADLKIGHNILTKTTNHLTTEREMDSPAFIKDGRTMIPIRFVAEALGFEVDWIEESRTVVLKDKTFLAEIPVDTNKIIINGIVYESDVKPLIVNDRTMFPVANLARTLGLEDGTDIIWKAETKEVTIIRQIKP